MNQSRDICRTCLCVGNTTFLSLDSTFSHLDFISIRETISFCMPEFDFDVVPTSVICGLCLSALQTAFTFKKKCDETQARIQEYIDNTKGIYHTLDLKKVIDFIKLNSNADLLQKELVNSSNEVAVYDDKFNLNKSIGENLLETETEVKQEVIEIYDISDVTTVKSEPMDYIDELESNVGENNDMLEDSQTVSDVENSCKAHKCTVCEKSYKLEIGLIAHMRTHQINQPKEESNSTCDPIPYPESDVITGVKQFLPMQCDNMRTHTEMSEKEEENLPSDVEEEALEAVGKLLPQKSRLIYEKEYICFQNWKTGKNINSASQEVLLAYFLEKSKKVKPSTLWSYYSMLKSTLLVNENCDISKYSELITLLKKLTDGYKPKKSKVFEPEDMRKFLEEAADDDYLFMKVVAIMALYGACRSIELYKLETSHVDDRQSVIIVSLIDTKTKKDRSFCITDKQSGVSVLNIVRNYVALRPKNVPHQKFFLNYQHRKCTIQPVGINTFYNVPKKIAVFLKLPNAESYTAHCFRRSAASMLANSGANLITVKRAGGWKSSSTVESHIEYGIENSCSYSSGFTSVHLSH